MTTKIWKVQFKENMDRYDVVAKNAGQAVKIAVGLFQAYVNANVKEARAENRPESEISPWTWYVRHGYNTPEIIELIAESDN